jgi:uncharacterized repeat protein (TIGR01451 family)
MKINKTADVSDVHVGDLVNFTITVKNHGKSNATGIVITDVLDDAFEFVGANGTFTRDGQTIVWTVPRIASEGVYEVVVSVRALTNGTFENIAHVNCSEEGTVKNSTSTVTVAPKVNLTVVKTADVDVVPVGLDVTFTINVTNYGPSNATDVVITDVVPSGFEFVSSSVGDYNETSGVLIVPLIKAGDSYVFTITLKAIANSTLTNVVNVTCNENKNVVSNSSNVTAENVVNLTVVKVADSDDATIGDEITFTITVTNNGPSDATNVTVVDVLDVDGFELVDGDLVTVIDFLASGNSTDVVIKVRTKTNGTHVNVVDVSCAENTTVKSANASVHVYNTDLKINKTTETNNVSVNDLVNFTIVVKNHGKSNATNVNITDVLDDAFEFVGANGTFTRDGQTIVWTVPSLASEGIYEVVVTVRALTNGTFENTAHVNCSEEGTVKNSTVTVVVVSSVQPTPVINLTVVKVADSYEVKLGDEIIFTINVTNHGPSNATNVVVEDVLPDGFELISGDTKVIIDSLSTGESKVITIKVKATNTGNLTNVASAYADENTTPVKSNVTVLVTNPQLSVNKTANDEFVYAGDKTSFTITITNTGDVVLNNVTLDENIPEGLIYDSFIGSNWTNEGTTFLYNGSLGVGDSIELIIVVNTTKSGTFESISTVDSDKVHNIVVDASVIVYTPNITVREISNNPLVYVGDSVSFTVVVTNVGDCELTGIYTVNNFPDGLIYTKYEGASWNKLTRGLLGVDTSGWTQEGNKFSYSGTLQPGESANYTLFFDTTVEGVFTPEVIANSNEVGGTYSNNTTVVISHGPIPVHPSMTVTKVANVTSVNVGELVSFKITVKNTGDCDLGGIFVIEKAPKGLKFVSFEGDGWTKVGDKFIYAGILAPQKSASFIVVFNATIAGNVTNVVIAGSNMTANVTSSVDVEIVNKTEPTPHPTPESGKPVTQYVDKHATGNPIILLLLVILAIIPIRIRKK